MQNHFPAEQGTQGLTKKQKQVAYILVGVAVAYYLWGWHKDHVLQYWPFAIFLLCPLMHLFMHGSHDHGGHGDSGGSQHGSEKKHEGKHGCH